MLTQQKNAGNTAIAKYMTLNALGYDVSHETRDSVLIATHPLVIISAMATVTSFTLPNGSNTPSLTPDLHQVEIARPAPTTIAKSI